MVFQNSMVMPSPLSQHAGRYLLETIVADTDATIDFTSNIDDTYDRYEFELHNIIGSVDGNDINMRFSGDGGSTWKSSASSYRRACIQVKTDASVSSTFTSDVGIRLQDSGIGNAAGETFNSVVTIFKPSVVGTVKRVSFLSNHSSSNGHTIISIGGGHYNSDTAIVNACQFYFNSGNIVSGKFKLYGIK
jgi:hypothetical protein